MKTLLFKTCFWAALLVAISSHTYANFEKNIHKNWPINQVKAISVDNKFGNINFISSRDDSVVIDVDILIEDRKAEFLAEQLTFNFSFSNGTIFAETKFGDRFKTNNDFNIVYTIYIPNDRHLMVENQYGNVTLGDLNAKGDFEIKYGNIHGAKLQAPSNEEIKLEIKYGNAVFQEVNRINAEVDYSKLTVGDVEQATLDSKYSIIKTGEIGSFSSESKYDNYKIKSVDKLKADSKYTQWDIYRLTRTLSIDNQYGDITIDEVDDAFEAIKIESDYATIGVGMSEQASYKLKGECYYCDIKHADGKVIKDIKDNNNIYKRIDIGSPTDSYIEIESRFGDIKLTK